MESNNTLAAANEKPPCNLLNAAAKPTKAPIISTNATHGLIIPLSQLSSVNVFNAFANINAAAAIATNINDIDDMDLKKFLLFAIFLDVCVITTTAAVITAKSNDIPLITSINLSVSVKFVSTNNEAANTAIAIANDLITSA